MEHRYATNPFSCPVKRAVNATGCVGEQGQSAASQPYMSAARDGGQDIHATCVPFSDTNTANTS